jgi:hypothetical protein
MKCKREEEKAKKGERREKEIAAADIRLLIEGSLIK